MPLAVRAESARTSGIEPSVRSVAADFSRDEEGGMDRRFVLQSGHGQGGIPMPVVRPVVIVMS